MLTWLKLAEARKHLAFERWEEAKAAGARPSHPSRSVSRGAAAPAPAGGRTAREGEGAAAETFVGRRLMYNWEGVGWCEGVVEARNTDKRFQMGGEMVNFWVHYELDDNLSKHVLGSDDYEFGEKVQEYREIATSCMV